MAQRTKKEKIQLTSELVDTLGASDVLYLTDFTGLNVKEITELRRRLREAGHRYVVVKNRLALRAVEQLDLPDLSEYLQGPTGFVVGADDPVAPAKMLRDFAKENEDRPTLKVGVVERRVVPADEIMTLASLPSRQELLAGIVGSLTAPVAGIVGVLEGLLRDVASMVEEVAKKQEGNQ
ncbi:MAG: 50S ribosomal protein L10 [Gemmatimonadales bacterium]|jgi:large subunit ribosomal protein L10